MNKFHPSHFFDLSSFRHSLLFSKVKYVWDALSKINLYLVSQPLGNIETELPSSAFLIHPEKISIGKGTIIEPGAYIQGPCIIGEHCVVRHGAYIRGDFIAGNHCVIGHTTEIKNTIFLNGVHAAHFAYVGDSILGNEVNLGAGTKCANLKFDGSQIVIYDGKEEIKTGLRKFGVVMADRSQTGCNAVTNPGTLVGKNSCCYPCINFGGVIEADSIVKPAKKPTISSFVIKR